MMICFILPTPGSTASIVPEPTKSSDRGVTTDTLRPTSTEKWSKIRNDMLLCVVGRRAVSKKMFPQDGVCTHVFYAHVVLEGNRISDSETNASLTTFSAVARDSQRTGYGLSFDFRKSVQSNVAAQTTGGRSMLGDLWQTNKVQHHGILNAVVPSTNMDDIVKDELKLIEVELPKTNDAKTLHKRRRPPTRTTPRIRTTLKMPNNRNVIFEGQTHQPSCDTGAGYSVEWEALTPPSELRRYGLAHKFAAPEDT
ncbi:hypothetical protein HPB47_005134 [Ixodes persulcatus]|uniref:Uncharacterized protein n=1 Tax=Ixodes persulcatus TaxID=34615 RepID=A0AC60PDV3_IXOPE|nr:hypothetical protein HPB47_005134 [Ixodes persulcatus]